MIKLPYMDSVFLDGQKGWAVSIMDNFLLEVDFECNRLCYKKEISEKKEDCFRGNPVCVKAGSYLFLLPHYGDAVVCYSLRDGEVKKIRFPGCDGKQMLISNYIYQEQEQCLYIISSAWQTVFQISITDKEIKKKYVIAEGKEGFGKCIVIGHFFCIVTNTNKLYFFDTNNKCVYQEVLPVYEDTLYSLAYDGENFWFGGYWKRIYRWNHITKELKVIEKFPSNFGVYDFSADGELDVITRKYELPVFIDIVPSACGVWFIPFQTSEILYTKDKGETVEAFPVADEYEDMDSIKRELQHKYIVLWSDGKKSLLYSLKNRSIRELDLVNHKWKNIELKLSARDYFEHVIKKEIVSEDREFTLNDYLRTLVD